MRKTTQTRADVFIRAVDALTDGLNVEIQGTHGVGKTQLVTRLTAHFHSLHYSVLTVSGNTPLFHTPYSALNLAGIDTAPKARSTYVTGLRERLGEQLDTSRNLIIIDDVDSVDRPTLGVLLAHAKEHAVPILTTTMYPSHPHATLGLSHTPLVLRYAPMHYAELAAVLEERFGAPFEAETMSRIYAKSGGRPGLAIHTAALALQNGRVRSESGVYLAVDTMWSSELTGYLAAMTAELSPVQLEALKLMAFVGACDFATATAVTGNTDTLLDLERLGLITYAADTANGAVLVEPQFLVDYFRGEEPPASRRILMERIRHATAGKDLVMGAEDADLPPMVLVRLVHENIRNEVLEARENWHLTHNLEDAAVLLRALTGDWHSTSANDEILTLIASTDPSAGTAAARVEWELAYSTRVAFTEKSPQRAIDRLRSLTGLPSDLQLLCDAEASLLETFAGTLSDFEPFAETRLEALPAQQRLAVLRARTLWLLAAGRPKEVHALIEQHYSFDEQDPHLDSVYAQTQFALRDFESGYRLVTQRLEQAKQQFNPRSLSIFSHLSALAAIYRRDYVTAQQNLDLADQMGIPLAAAPSAALGTVILKAYLLAENGAVTDAEGQLRAFEEFAVVDPPFPGYLRGMVDHKVAHALSGSVRGVETGMAAGDALWARRAYYGAALTYLEVLQTAPSPELYTRIAARLQPLDIPIVQVWLTLLDIGINNNQLALDRNASRFDDPIERDRLFDAASYVAGGFSEDFVSQLLQHPELQPIGQRLRRQNTLNAHDPVVVLTDREEEIAVLVSAGLSNPQIAEHLTLSVRTVEGHISRILKKLQKPRREEITSFLLQRSARQRTLRVNPKK